jgi:SAM-dependent methyltransferase
MGVKFSNHRSKQMSGQQRSDADQIKTGVRARYGQVAEKVLEDIASTSQPVIPRADQEIIPLEAASCCAPDDGALAQSGYAFQLYDSSQLADLPNSVTGASLGCGNPTAIAALQPGQVVLDLGSGGGIDCFLAARQVGPTGWAFGLDMTPAMIDLAERNKARLGDAASNVSFHLGEMEAIPLPDESVDVIISNCVINLSPDKEAVFREALRVLRPGGYLAVSDIVALQPLPEWLTEDPVAWSNCVSGALTVDGFAAKLRSAGFREVEITGLTPTAWDMASDSCCDNGSDGTESGSQEHEVLIASAQIMARKAR